VKYGTARAAVYSGNDAGDSSFNLHENFFRVASTCTGWTAPGPQPMHRIGLERWALALSAKLGMIRPAAGGAGEHMIYDEYLTTAELPALDPGSGRGLEPDRFVSEP